jgi:hypothetical protein
MATSFGHFDQHQAIATYNLKDMLHVVLIDFKSYGIPFTQMSKSANNLQLFRILRLLLRSKLQKRLNLKLDPLTRRRSSKFIAPLNSVRTLPCTEAVNGEGEVHHSYGTNETYHKEQPELHSKH